MDLDAELTRHVRRREDGIPTISTVVGPILKTLEWVKRWVHVRDLQPVEISSSDQLVEWLRLQRARIVRSLSSSDLARLPELREVIAGPVPELPLRLKQALSRCSPPQQTALQRWLIEDRLEPSDISVLGPLLDLNTTSAFVFVAPSRHTAAFSAQLVQRDPRLTVVLAVADLSTLALLSERDTRLVNESLVRLDGPETVDISPLRDPKLPRGVGDSKNEARSFEQRIRKLTQNEAVFEYARLAWTARETSGRPGASPDAAERARSHAERLLYELLECNSETRGLFALNVKLDIQFGTRPAEVDLLSNKLSVALEVDGYYHFRDAECYRRDRRKDVLLQDYGLRVVRVLADDIVERTDEVLTFVKRALPRGPELR